MNIENREIFKNLINKVVQGDCLEVMRKIPDNSIDVTFADPPFNLKKKYNSYYDKHEIEEYLAWCKNWLTEMVRITKPKPTCANERIHILNSPLHLYLFFLLHSEEKNIRRGITGRVSRFFIILKIIIKIKKVEGK